MRKYHLAALLLSCVFAFGSVALTTHVKRATAYGTTDGTFYVSPSGSDSNPGTLSQPFQTIEKAREAVRSLISGGMTSDVIVMLRGGRYYESSPVVFDDQDSGRDGYKVVYTNYPGEEPIIVGGQRITGWSYDPSFNTDNPHAPADAHVYKAYVGTSWTFHDLYENGQLQTEARTPNKGSYFIATGVDTDSGATEDQQRTIFYYDSSDVPDSVADDISAAIPSSDTDPGPQVYTWPYEPFFTDTTPIGAIDKTDHKITLASDALLPFATGNRYYVQGFADALDSAGEWYLDHANGYLYYWPQHTPIADQQIVAPTEQDVFELKGSSSTAQTENIDIDGLTFLGSDFTDNFDETHDVAWNRPADPNRHGIIYLENAANDTVEDCKIIGSGFNGVELNTYSDHNTIAGNDISQSGYFGVMLTGTDVGALDGSSEQIYDNHDNTISDNSIRDSGRNVGNGGGIFVYQSGNNEITHNNINGAPRYGIAIKGLIMHTDDPGSMAGTYGQLTVDWDNHWDFLTSRNNDVEYNDISNVNQDSVDAGIISMYGTGKGNIIENNRLHDVHRDNLYGLNQGIYLDDGTDYTTVDSNLIYGISGNLAINDGFFVKGIHNVIHNNVFVGGVGFSSGTGIESATYDTIRSDHNEFSDNIFYNSNDPYVFDNWEPERLTGSDFNDFYTTNTATTPCGSLYCFAGDGAPQNNLGDWQDSVSSYIPGVDNDSYGSVSVAETPSGTDKSLKFVDTNGSGGNGETIKRYFQPTSDDLTFQFDVMPSQTSGAIEFDMLCGSNTGLETMPVTSYTPACSGSGDAFAIALSSADTLRYWTSSGPTDVPGFAYSANTWYTIKIVAHLSSQTYDVSVNGTPEVTGVAFMNTISNPDEFYVATGTGTGTYYLNNLSIQTDGERYDNDSFDEYTTGGFPHYDEHSITSDPEFTDPSSNDYALESSSPALANGFVDLDYADIGLTSSHHLVQNLTAAQEGSDVDLSWDAVSGASSYVIRRTTDSGDDYTTVGTTSGTTYTDSTALDGQTYFYTVAAVTSGLEYPASTEVECDTVYPLSIVDDQFDTETTGAAPAGYTLETSGGTDEIANVPGSGNKSMELIDTSGGTGGVSALRTFNASSKTITFETRVSAAQTNGAIEFDLEDSSGTPAVSLALSAVDTLRYWKSAGLIDMTTYTTNTWYTLRVVADIPDQTFSIYINGTPYGSASFETAVSSIDRVSVSTGTGTGTYDVDYITVNGQALINDAFDGETTSASPAGYTLDTSAGGSVEIANVPGSGNKSMELVDTNATGAGVSATKPFPDHYEGTITYEIRIKASQTGGGIYLDLDDDSGTSAVDLAMSGTGKIRLWGSAGTVSTDIQSYSANTWYTLKIVADLSARTFNLYVDGTLATASPVAFDNSVDLVDRLTILTGYSTGTYDVDYAQVTDG